jgi:hypothetical protein
MQQGSRSRIADFILGATAQINEVFEHIVFNKLAA